MRFFNIDLHIGVISDIKDLLSGLGHTVDDRTLSAHAWALGRSRDQLDVINPGNWRQIDQDMCDAFYERYSDELSGYDGFIVTHTPCFAMLFERWNKPTVVVASTRYEHPFTGDRGRWQRFDSWLRARHDDGLLIPVANNSYDSWYAQLFTGFEWPVIPSYCGYTQLRHHSDPSAALLYWSNFRHSSLPGNLIDKESLKPGRLRRKMNQLPFVPTRQGFSWSDLAGYRGIVHVPYNVSVMSIFEHYAANIPLLFPDKDLLLGLYDGTGRNGVLSQLSFNQVYGLSPGSRVRSNACELDPNRYDSLGVVANALDHADFFDTSTMANIVHFSSFDQLREIMDSDLEVVSERMEQENRDRRQRIVSAWEHVMSDVAQRRRG